MYISLRILLETLISPMQEKMEEWKKAAVQLDRDHSKGWYLGNVLRGEKNVKRFSQNSNSQK